MNDVIQAIQSRRSVRSYKEDMVPREILDQIIAAGTWAPTGLNRQAPIILAVTNRALRDRISALNKQILDTRGGGRGGDPFYGAPVVLVVLANRNMDTYINDGSLVMGNLMLAASTLGVSSCWVHRAKETFETEEGKAILRELGISEDYVGIGNCILGYANGDIPAPKPRKENYVVWAE